LDSSHLPHQLSPATWFGSVAGMCQHITSLTRGAQMNSAERLTKLVLMLSSSHDGEVVNAARAIGRALQDDGADWHDLARRLSAPARARASETSHRETNDKDWRAMRAFCLQHMHVVSAREYEFLVDLDRWRGDLTEKQHAWLTSIYQRLQRANR
jgi:hypothetical protein